MAAVVVPTNDDAVADVIVNVTLFNHELFGEPELLNPDKVKIGRASCRERVFPRV